jgi:hypothetical protein
MLYGGERLTQANQRFGYAAAEVVKNKTDPRRNGDRLRKPPGDLALVRS